MLTRTGSRAGLLLTAALLSSCDAAGGGEDTLCPGRSIEVEQVHSLGAAEGDAALSNPLPVVEDQRGRLWVFGQGAMPVVFDGDGRCLATVGAGGEGPGEMLGPHHLWLLPGDSVAVLASRRLHIRDPDLGFVRQEPVPLLGAGDAVVLDWPAHVVVNALDPTPQRRDHPLHRVDFSGPEPSVVASFGGD